MSALGRLLFRIELALRRGRIERELSQEIEAHLEMAAEAKIAAGRQADEARLEALRQFGGVDQVKEAYRDERGFPWLEQILQDARLTARSLRKDPGYAAVCLLTVALGICLTAVAFSLLDAFVYRPVPFADPGRIVRIYHTDASSGMGPNAPGDLFDARAQNQVFSHLAIVDFPSYSLAVRGRPAERVAANAVSGDFFPLVDARPLLGRVFGNDEDRAGKDNVVVLGYRFWRSRFGADPAVVGTTIRLDGEPVTVIGVMPEAFYFPQLFRPCDLWKPLAMDPKLAQARDGHWLSAIARLKPGVTIAEAQGNLDVIGGRLARQYPATNARTGFHLAYLTDRSGEEPLFKMIMGLSLSVLLIACANLANLQLARNSARAREFGIRLALGSTRSRLARQVLTESLVLALAGSAIGVACARVANAVLAARLASVIDQPEFTLPVDLRVLGFSLVAALATGVLFGMAPALVTSGVNVNASLRLGGPGVTGGRSRHRLRGILVVGEMGLTLAVLAATGFFMEAIRSYAPKAVGWDWDHLAMARIALPGGRYGSVEQCAAFYGRVMAELSTVPGVEQPLVCDVVPIGGFYNSHPIIAQGAPAPADGKETVAPMNTTTPGYFRALRMRVIRGRDFTPADRSGAPAVAVVDEALAERLWPGQDPLGRRFGTTDAEHRDWLTVVGVVNNIGFNGNRPAEAERNIQYYRPIAQTGGNYFTVAARTSVPPGEVTEQIRRAVFRVDPDQAVYELSTVDSIMEENQRGDRLVETTLLVIAISGLVLSAVGLFGVVSNLVVEQTSEIGIRIALGAAVPQVVRSVMGRGLRLAAAGITLGVAGAWAVGRLLIASFGGGDFRVDPLLVAVCCLVLGAVALLACWIPASRAARIDPIQALRAE